ncbi:MAG TPA: glycosyltransferase family 87 protein [Caulobacteraceae bacterium]|jgi:hypothetical protein|nr:glycosyltransferase family 87 protein [Caulobacteraceae bacterium]
MTRAVASLAAVIRDADWLTRERTLAYGRILFTITLATLVGWVAFSHGGLDPLGKPLGTDFLSFWAASRLALGGHPALAYDLARHAGAERAAFGGAPLGYAAFFYPPLFLLVCLPLGLVPYLPALAAWLGATGYACWRAIRAILGEARAGLVLPMLAFPGVFSTLGHGQNAFLTAALFGLGALLLDRRPILAGVCLGLLAFKPHLGLLIPIALVAGGRWKTVAAATLTVLAFAALSALAFGAETWRAFLAVSPLARAALEQDIVGPAKMTSAFAAVRLLHGGPALAYAAQAAFAGLAAVIVALTARARAGGLAEGAVLAAASLLASPFLLDYDLMILAVPMAWMVREAGRTGFLPWEKTVLFAAFVSPLVARMLAARFGLPLEPLVVLALLLAAARRAGAFGPVRAGPAPVAAVALARG